MFNISRIPARYFLKSSNFSKGTNQVVRIEKQAAVSRKHATFLRHGRLPEENILHASKVVSPRFLN